jgi:hypothetical protein
MAISHPRRHPHVDIATPSLLLTLRHVTGDLYIPMG